MRSVWRWLPAIGLLVSGQPLKLRANQVLRQPGSYRAIRGDNVVEEVPRVFVFDTRRAMRDATNERIEVGTVAKLRHLRHVLGVREHRVELAGLCLFE